MPIACDIVACGRYYRIHISQHIVIGVLAKVSHFEVLCRAHGFEPTVGLFRCLYVNSKNKGWMSFTCPASFPWNTSKSVPKDPFPKSSEFNAKHYATLVAHPAPFHKYPEPFLCLVGISRYYTLDENTYPQFLRDDDEDGVNLSRRGVLLDSHLCPLCNAAMEDVQHVFFRCDVARVVLRKICRWWDLDWQEICSFSDWDA
ncbi:gypsy type transposase [Tanacetum coccineum]